MGFWGWVWGGTSRSHALKTNRNGRFTDLMTRLRDTGAHQAAPALHGWSDRFACEAMEQADPPNITITASKPPEPSLHSPMTVSGRNASAAANILSHRRYLPPAFLALISHGGRNDH